MLKVNIGAGDHYQEGWINTDITEPEGHRPPDVICSATELPFEDASVDRLYAGHVLEHLKPTDVVKALHEFQRVIRPEGQIMIVLPDLDVAEDRYPELIGPIRDGGDRWSGDRHLWESRPAEFEKTLKKAKVTATRLSINDLIGTEWPVVAYVDWQYVYQI